MPILDVTLSGQPDSGLSRQVASRLSDLTREGLRKDPTLTAVALTHVDPAHWFVGGHSLAEQDLRSFWLDIKVVDGTNTKQELAGYLQAVFAAMQDILGPLHDESYILVHEVPASAYGYGGKTQEFRFISGQLAGALR